MKFFGASGMEGEFEYFQSKYDNNLPMIATAIASQFHEVWWRNAKYKDRRKQLKAIAKEGLSLPFKIEISELLKSYELSNDFESEIQLLRSSIVDGIVTTNWDQFLENIFREFKVYIGQQELLFSESISVGEIYKIHGCVTRPRSIVVTDEDYQNFANRNAYLAAKLLTIFVEHPIIFLGYSLSDPNILQIIDSIVRCVEPTNIEKLKDRLIFVTWRKGQAFEMKDSALMLPENKVLPIKLIQTDSFLPIFESLSILKRKIPVKVLRKLKDSVVEFVKASSPTSQVFVKDIDSITDETKIEYAIGVGVATNLISSQGYKGLDASDIIEDVIFDNKGYDSKLLINETFPKLIKGNAYIPVYKYLRQEEMLTKLGGLTQSAASKIAFQLRKNPPSGFLPPSAYMKKQNEIRRNHKDISSIINAFDKEHCFVYIPLLELKNIDISQLEKFLRSCFGDTAFRKSSNFRKLVCLFDFLRYGVA